LVNATTPPLLFKEPLKVSFNPSAPTSTVLTEPPPPPLKKPAPDMEPNRIVPVLAGKVVRVLFCAWLNIQRALALPALVELKRVMELALF